MRGIFRRCLEKCLALLLLYKAQKNCYNSHSTPKFPFYETDFQFAVCVFGRRLAKMKLENAKEVFVMAKKLIGQLIMTLRKKRGMTQQDIADRLYVSNKAVSRWERDECAPDISLIPDLAALLGVSCDELLRGEQVFSEETAKREERQENRWENRRLDRCLDWFKKRIGIAFALAVIGLVLMFAVYYAAYQPIIGFAGMLSFEICAAVVALLAVSRARDFKRDREIFDAAEDAMRIHFHRVLGQFSFCAIYTAFSVIALSVPFLVYAWGDGSRIMIPHVYVNTFLGPVLAFLLFVYLVTKKTYVAWITDGELPREEKTTLISKIKMMDLVQRGLAVLAMVVLIYAPLLRSNSFEDRFEITAEYKIALITVYALLALSILYFAVQVIRDEERKSLLLPGIRNICLLPAVFAMGNLYTFGWMRKRPLHQDVSWEDAPIVRTEGWRWEVLLEVILYCAAVFLVFFLINAFMKARKKNASHKKLEEAVGDT